MPEVKFLKSGKMADNGKSGMPQFKHSKGETVEVSAVCASAAVAYGIAEHVVDLDKKAKRKPGPKSKAEKNPAEDDKQESEG